MRHIPCVHRPAVVTGIPNDGNDGCLETLILCYPECTPERGRNVLRDLSPPTFQIYVRPPRFTLKIAVGHMFRVPDPDHMLSSGATYIRIVRGLWNRGAAVT